MMFYLKRELLDSLPVLDYVIVIDFVSVFLQEWKLQSHQLV